MESQVGKCWKSGNELQINGMSDKWITGGKQWQMGDRSQERRGCIEEVLEGNSKNCIMKYHIRVVTF